MLIAGETIPVRTGPIDPSDPIDPIDPSDPIDPLKPIEPIEANNNLREEGVSIETPVNTFDIISQPNTEALSMPIHQNFASRISVKGSNAKEEATPSTLIQNVTPTSDSTTHAFSSADFANEVLTAILGPGNENQQALGSSFRVDVLLDLEGRVISYTIDDHDSQLTDEQIRTIELKLSSLRLDTTGMTAGSNRCFLCSFQVETANNGNLSIRNLDAYGL